MDFFCFIFPFAFSFHPAFRFYRQWRVFLPANLITACFFISWDILYTHLGVWEFNPNYTLSPRFFNLPLEEVFFFVAIPYACVFSYHCLTLYVQRSFDPRFWDSLSILLPVLLLVVAVLHFEKLYTSVTFTLLGLFIVFLKFRKVNYLYRFFICFLFIFPFFMISNGILTGSFIDEPVVNYNDSLYLGVRLFTIPLEDVFYGMLLLLCNISLFELFISRRKRT